MTINDGQYLALQIVAKWSSRALDEHMMTTYDNLNSALCILLQTLFIGSSRL